MTVLAGGFDPGDRYQKPLPRGNVCDGKGTARPFIITYSAWELLYLD